MKIPKLSSLFTVQYTVQDLPHDGRPQDPQVRWVGDKAKQTNQRALPGGAYPGDKEGWLDVVGRRHAEI